MIEQPNYTQIPNLFLDEYMRKLCASELKVCLAIARQTFGWHKKGDKLSIKQLCVMTGMSNRAICTAIESLLKQKIVIRVADGQGFVYSLSISTCEESSQPNSQTCEESSQLPMKKVHSKPMKNLHTQNKYIKKEKESVLSAAQPTPSEQPQPAQPVVQPVQPTVTEPNIVTEEIPPTPSVAPVSPPPTEQQRKFQLLCNIVGWDHKVITKEQVGQVAQTLGILGKAGYTEEHLKQFFEKVWSKDWRWMNHHSYPTLAQVRMEIGKLKMTIADVVPVRQVETVAESAPIPHFQRLQQRKGFYTQ